MKSKQWFLVFSGLALLFVLFKWGELTPSEKKTLPSSPPTNIEKFDIQQFIKEKAASSPIQKQLEALSQQANSAADITARSTSYTQLANLWKDSLKQLEIYSFYIGEAAKLDNSEKNLTFAAQLFLGALRAEHDDQLLNWECESAIDLFNRALAINPANDDIKIGLASCYIYGKGRNGDPQETMKGIQGLLEVVRRDSTNMKAQMVLGVGGYVSGQYDKAIARLNKVVAAESGNIEAIAFLADSYAAKGDKQEAIKWYQQLKGLVNDPDYSKEIDKRISEINKR